MTARRGCTFPTATASSAPRSAGPCRTSGDPDAIANAVRSALAEQDRRLLLTEPRTWQSYMDEHIAPTRFALILIGVFAAVAAILAMIGLYGVLATTVRQRTTEIGVRMAFGASRGSIVSLIIGQGLRLSIGGIVLGVIAAIALTRVMASLLVGVSATDPATFAAMAVLFALDRGVRGVDSRAARRGRSIRTSRCEMTDGRVRALRTVLTRRACVFRIAPCPRYAP